MSGLMDVENSMNNDVKGGKLTDTPPPSGGESGNEAGLQSEVSSVGDVDSGFGLEADKMADTAVDTATDTCSTTSHENASSTSSRPYRSLGKEPPISVLQPSKIEREMSRISVSEPSTCAVLTKWIVTAILGIVCFSCVVINSVSFSGIAVRLYNDRYNMTSHRPFVMVLLILLLPNLLNLVRAVWVGLTRSDMPWPKSTSVAWIFVISIFESAGICIFAFKIFTMRYGLYGILTPGSLFLLPVLGTIFLLRKSESCTTLTKYATCSGLAFVLIGTGLVLWKSVDFLNASDAPMTDIWHLLLAVVFLSLCWTPQIQKKMVMSNVLIENDSLRTPKVPEYVTLDSENSDSTFDLLRDKIFQDDSDVDINKDSCWKSTFLQCFFRIPAVIGFSFLFFFVDSQNTTPQFSVMMDKIKHSFSWNAGDVSTQLFIINVLSALVGYSSGLAACRVNMQRGAFVLPVVLAPPASLLLFNMEWICEHVFDHQGAVCSGEVYWSVIIVCCMFFGMVLSYGVMMWETRNLVLHPESDLYWLPAYPGVLLNEWMFLGRRIQRRQEVKEEPRDHGRKTAVYICTTMYRETLDEMRQLLESIGQINLAQAHCDRHFESHIFFDGGVKDRTPTEFALQLISLLPITLNLTVDSCTKASTPYGLRLTWRIPVPGKVLNEQTGMIFMIHLKDNRKVKNQKRWSQIMYMSYILDFLNCRASDDNNTADDESFILTTDADVKFTPDSVEALLDLMARDKTVGAVCARTHPLGSGPVVWYQVFEYAIGHWFQKAAEHVLGSVLCAPGCFSVYRLRAVRDVVKTYASDVEEAFDFLIKDMGEDRWFGTLMIQSGWRIEYCAAAENSTCCPEDFEEFYKQRRRWIVSTVANLMLLMKEWNKVSRFNHRVSVLFTCYQALLLISTLIGPSVVILVVSGGLLYGWGVNVFTSITLQCLVSVGFAFICLYTQQSTQMTTAKILTLVYACVMMSVMIGIAENVVHDYRNGGISLNSTVLDNPHAKVVYIPVSLATFYLALLAGIFVVTGLLHPSELGCLIHGIWYLLCLPSGYLVLNIYSIANMTDRSWGTREEGTKQNTEWSKKTLFQFIRDVRSKCCFCFGKTDENFRFPVLSFGKNRTSSLSESQPSGKVAFPDSVRKISDDSQPKVTENTEGGDVQSNWKESSISSGPFSEWFPEEDVPIPVEEWLDRELRTEYLYQFKKHGFDNTIFISAMKESDLIKIGVKRKSHVTYLLQQIQDLPSFHIETRIPDDVLSWLQDVGLERYYPNFRCNKLTFAPTLEVLKSITPKEIEQDLKITKAGHIKRLMYAIKQLRNPTQEERRRIQVKRDLENTPYHRLENFNRGELKFWSELKEACLQPFSVAFGHTQELKDKLGKLRNNFLLIIAITNTLWLILLITLGTKMELRIVGTDAVGLAFLCIFGCIYVLQFLCMLVHRVMTFGHYCARAPYRFDQAYNYAWSFNDNREFEVSKTLNPHDIRVIAAAKEAEKNSRTMLKERRKFRRRRKPVFDEETGKEPLLGETREKSVPYETFNYFSLR